MPVVVAINQNNNSKFSNQMTRSAVIVGNYKCSGTDAHRTLLHVGSLWRHHLHDVERDPKRVELVGAELVNSLESLINLDNTVPKLDLNAGLELGARLEHLGELAASKIDEIDPQKLNTWLANLWPMLAKLHSADTQDPAKPNIGKVVGIQASTNSVPKTSIARGIVNCDGLVGDRQMARTHHGRPWQALCIWSDEVIAQHEKA